MISSNKRLVQVLVENCIIAGMKTVVCSPGSRNAPLVIALDEHPEMNCFVIHDERSAAFVAMGMAQELDQPVGVVCTSGSAMLNYYPAVAEAFYQRIPLVVISADRPEKWINQGDGQTIVQNGVYQNHIDAEIHLSEEMKDFDIKSSVLKAFEQISTFSKGPIHINVALEEPLYITEEIDSKMLDPIIWQRPKVGLSDTQKQLIQNGIMLPKKLVLVGQMPKNERFFEKLAELANDPSYAILVENTSNLVSPKWIHCIDRTLSRIASENESDFAPNLLITFGGAIVSKRIKAYFRKYRPQMHWKVGFDFPEMDTFEALTESFTMNEADFLEELIVLKQDVLPENFGSRWKQLDFEASDLSQNFVSKTTFSDLKVIDLMLDTVPENSHIHMGNSSIVRYCQLFNPIKSCTYFSNRGTSGIDGSSSTALGAALVKKDVLHVLFTGDVSFFYDSNALWNNYLVPNLRIVLVNNGGGGIFNIIQGPRSSKQNKNYFVAAHEFNAKDLCRAFHVEYFSADSIQSVETVLDDFYSFDQDGGIKLLEINTANIPNHLILDAYFENLKPINS